MPQKVRRHIRSNGVAYLALIVSLSGSAYATATIGSADIKRDAVKSRHIENGQVRGEDVADASLTGRDVKLDSLTGQDIKESTLVGKCPSGSNLVARGDLCYTNDDFTPWGFPATSMDFPGALTTCANLGLRLPTLAEAFEASVFWPAEGFYWTADTWKEGEVNYAWIYQYPQSFGSRTWTLTARVRCVGNPTP